MRPLHSVRIFAVIILFSVTGLAQQSVTSATLSGQVEDTSGAAIAAATVAITNVERNQTSTTLTDEQGRFRFLYLPVGAYQLRVERTGFATFTSTLTLTIGQAIDVAVQLGIAGVNTEVNVTG